jgi:hypothetical protein
MKQDKGKILTAARDNKHIAYKGMVISRILSRNTAGQ